MWPAHQLPGRRCYLPQARLRWRRGGGRSRKGKGPAPLQTADTGSCRERPGWQMHGGVAVHHLHAV